MKYFAVFALLFCLLGTALAALKNPVCGEEPRSNGPCRGRFNKYTYLENENECVQFFYNGCGENNNNFNSQDECERTCKN
uniref:Trypsin inhibitor-like n=1 Tax=Drosophila rhopaloa TaxID=1041015 RepID=A0A6P4F674_DRORH